MSEPRPPSAFSFMDDEDGERRTPSQYLFDVALLPGIVLLLTATVFLLASLGIYGVLLIWARIYQMVQ